MRTFVPATILARIARYSDLVLIYPRHPLPCHTTVIQEAIHRALNDDSEGTDPQWPHNTQTAQAAVKGDGA